MIHIQAYLILFKYRTLFKVVLHLITEAADKNLRLWPQVHTWAAPLKDKLISSARLLTIKQIAPMCLLTLRNVPMEGLDIAHKKFQKREYFYFVFPFVFFADDDAQSDVLAYVARFHQ